MSVDVVDGPLHLQRAESFRGVVPDFFHDGGDFRGAFLALQDKGNLVLGEVAVLLIQRVQVIAEGHALFAVIRCHLHDQHGGADAVLVADRLPRRAADALFIAEEIAVSEGLGLRDHAADVLEAGQGLKHADSVSFADGLPHVARHDGFNHGSPLRQGPLVLHALRHVSDQHRAGLIAVQGAESALSVRNLNRHAVAVRVGGDQHLGLHFFSELLSQSEALRVLRVRVPDGGEFRIRVFLFGNDAEARVAFLLRELLHGDAARAVQGRVHHGHGFVQLLRRPLGHGLHIVQILPVHLLPEHHHEALLHRFLQRDARKFIKEVQF